MKWKSCVGKSKSSFGDVIIRVIKSKEVLIDVWEFYDDHLTMVQRGNHYNGDTYYYKDLQWLDETEDNEKDAYIQYVQEKIELNLAPFRFHEWQEMEKFAIEYRLKHK